MTTDNSDGRSEKIHLAEPTTESIRSSEAGEATTPTPCPPSRRHIGDFSCRTFAFIGGDKPHFLFSSVEGWGRFYVTDTQVALCVEDGSRFIGDLVRAKPRA